MQKAIYINDAKDVQKNIKIYNVEQESFRVLILNQKNLLIKQELIFLGTANNCSIHPRDIFRETIRHNGVGIILVHNHPSGDPTPSDDDKKITDIIVSAGKLLGIEVLDHVILGDNKHFSFVDRGIMPQVLLRKKHDGDDKDEK